MDIISHIFKLYSLRGGTAYFGEPLTQLEHAIQTALAAKRNESNSVIITAALLHDIGHFLHPHSENCADKQIDSQHELAGEKFLKVYFVPEVAELVKHHVNAKRYLTAVDKTYYANLSSASLHSLQLQGGPMQKHEAAAFKKHPLFEKILKLRYWDEGAKIPNKPLPPIEDFSAALKESLHHE